MGSMNRGRVVYLVLAQGWPPPWGDDKLEIDGNQGISCINTHNDKFLPLYVILAGVDVVNSWCWWSWLRSWLQGRQEKENTAPTGKPLFAWIKDVIYIWCKLQANSHPQIRKSIVSGGQEGPEKNHVLCLYYFSTFYNSPLLRFWW